MIKAVVKFAEGPHLIALGLTADNIALLQQGKPMFIDGRELMVNLNIVVFAGEDEADVTRQVDKLLGANGAGNTERFTCCEKHAKAAGLPHRPRPGFACPDDASGLAEA